MPPPEQAQMARPGVDDDPFKYGWRYVKRTLPDGTVELDQIPLTLEDVLHPEEDDFIVESDRHDTERAYLKGILRARVVEPPVVGVYSDLRIDWGVRGLRVHGPDVAVFVGMTHPPADDAGTLYRAQTGGRCVFVAEITSPSTRSNDVGPKFDHYHRAGIPLYVVVDQQVEGGSRTLAGYRRSRKGYAEIGLDAQGRLLLQPFGLWLKLVDNRLVCQDVATGRVYSSWDQHVVGLEQADHKLQEQSELLEESIEAQHAAERKAKAATKAQRAAEKREADQVRARKVAEREKEKERMARLAAEREMQQEQSARQALEARLRELEAQLRRSQGE